MGFRNNSNPLQERCTLNHQAPSQFLIPVLNKTEPHKMKSPSSFLPLDKPITRTLAMVLQTLDLPEAYRDPRRRKESLWGQPLSRLRSFSSVLDPAQGKVQPRGRAFSQVIACDNWEETHRDKKQKELSKMIVHWVKTHSDKPQAEFDPWNLQDQRRKPASSVCPLTSIHTIPALPPKKKKWINKWEK